jgi:UDP-glucose 4-epimerase
MKALVTGGKGFIGSHVVELLLGEGHEVIAIDDESATENGIFYKIGGAKYHKLDIRDKDILPLFKGVDWVFHLAARSRIQPSLINPEETFDVNVMGTLNVLQASRHAGVSKVVYSGSSSYYGLKNQIPNTEDMPPDCLNPYSVSKYQGELICKMYSTLWEVPTVVLRYFNVYGPREPGKGQYAPVIGLFKRQRDAGEMLTIIGDGEQRRDFTHVKDVAMANYLAAQSAVVHDIFNVGTGTNHSVNQIAEMVGGVATYIPARPAESRETRADISKATRLLGWQPKFNLGSAINSY